MPWPGKVGDRRVLIVGYLIVLADDAGRGWATHEVSARVPDDSDAFVFGVFLAGAGQIEVRNTELAVELT
jgi:hypothetical protein